MNDFDKGGKYQVSFAAVFNYFKRIGIPTTQKQWDMIYDVPDNITPFETALIEVIIKEMKGELK